MESTVMTFNLRVNATQDGENAWPYRIERAAQSILQADALIVGTQEGLYSMLTDLDQHLPQYEWLGEGRLGDNEGELCAIFYHTEAVQVLESGHFWLSETPTIPGSKSWDSSLPRMCTWAHVQLRQQPDTQFIVYNTHLDHRGQEAREKGIEIICNMIKKHQLEKELPILLMGDMNATPDHRVIRFLRGVEKLGDVSVELTDAYTALKGEPGATFHGFNGGKQGQPIDYIFTSTDVSVVSTYIERSMIDGGYPSDHYPVVTKVDIPSASKKHY